MVAPVRFELTHDGTKTRCLTAWLWGKMVEGEGFEPPNREEVGYSHPRLAASLPLHLHKQCNYNIKTFFAYSILIEKINFVCNIF